MCPASSAARQLLDTGPLTASFAARSLGGPGRDPGFPLPPRPARPAEGHGRPVPRRPVAHRLPTLQGQAGGAECSTLPTVGRMTMLPEVLVRVLGPVEVIGAARPFRRAWCVELVTYLALHPTGATADAWTTALWPDRLPPEPTRFSTVSEARRALGCASDGSDHLPRGVGRLRLAPSVTTDWAQFRSLAAVQGPRAAGAWAAALELVRGPLLGGLRSADWAVLEGLQAEMEGAIVQLAIDAAEHRLARGDGRGAELAVRRGLLVSPYDERLYRLLFAAADSKGNPAGVESAMGELLRLVSGEAVHQLRVPHGGPVDPAEWVHPETAAMYRSLSRRPTPHAPGDGRRPLR